MSRFEFWNDANNPSHPASAPDYLPHEQLRAMQLHRLKITVARAYANVPLFRQRMDERGLRPDHLRAIEDVAKLPFTVKADLRDTYPYGLFASPLSEIVRLHASSGTTGKPIVVAYTQHDLDVWQSVVVRSLTAAGLRSGDIVQNAFGYGLFTGGLGMHGGIEALGATVIPISGGNTDRQLMLMKDFGVTAIVCTPSYFLYLLEEGRKCGIDLRELPLRVGVFGAEPWTNEMRARIEDGAGIEAFDIYGLSEIIGPGVAVECARHCGLHIFEDHFLPEIIDPDTGEVLPDGATGELVLTTLSKEAMPMIRYRTRDLSRLIGERCACGRTLRRLERIAARSDDMLIIRGVNFFPSQIEAALLQVKAATPNYHIIVSREHGLDQVEVQVEITADQIGDDIRSVETLHRKISLSIERTTGLRMNVRLVPPNALPRSEGKARRVTDLRPKDQPPGGTP
ncbi:MAG: phenylacetate--CoA ligase family protein [Kiritimatiellia bacterium]